MSSEVLFNFINLFYSYACYVLATSIKSRLLGIMLETLIGVISFLYLPFATHTLIKYYLDQQAIVKELISRQKNLQAKNHL